MEVKKHYTLKPGYRLGDKVLAGVGRNNTADVGDLVTRSGYRAVVVGLTDDDLIVRNLYYDWED